MYDDLIETWSPGQGVHRRTATEWSPNRPDVVCPANGALDGYDPGEHAEPRRRRYDGHPGRL